MERTVKDKEFETINARVLLLSYISLPSTKLTLMIQDIARNVRRQKVGADIEQRIQIQRMFIHFLQRGKGGYERNSSQQVGWRQNYDTFDFGYKKDGVCKKTFFNTGHL